MRETTIAGRAAAFQWQSRQSPITGLLNLFLIHRQLAYNETVSLLEKEAITVDRAGRVYADLSRELKGKPVMPSRPRPDCS